MVKKNSDPYPRIYKTGPECKQLLIEAQTKKPSDFITPEMPDDYKKSLKDLDGKCFTIIPLIMLPIKDKIYILEIKKDSYFLKYNSRLRITPQLTALMRHHEDLPIYMITPRIYNIYRYPHSSKGTNTKADLIFFPEKRAFWAFSKEEMLYTLQIIGCPKMFIIDCAGIYPDNAQMNMDHLGPPPNVEQHKETWQKWWWDTFALPEERAKKGLPPKEYLSDLRPPPDNEEYIKWWNEQIAPLNGAK